MTTSLLINTIMWKQLKVQGLPRSAQGVHEQQANMWQWETPFPLGAASIENKGEQKALIQRHWWQTWS